MSKDTGAFERIVSGMTRPVSFSLAALYVVQGLSRLYLGAGGPGRVLVLIAFAAALALFLAGMLMGGRRSRIGGAHQAGIVMAAIVAAHSGLYLYLTGDPDASTTFALLILGLGIFFLDLRWFAAAVTLTLLSWTSAALAIDQLDPGEVLTLAATTLIAGVAILIRIRVYRQLNGLRSEAEEKAGALSQSEERYALALSGSNDGLYDWDISRNRIYFSERLTTMFGCDPDQMGPAVEALTDRIHPEDSERVKARLVSHLKGDEPYFEDEFRIRHEDGTYLWVLTRGASTRDTHGRAARMAGSITDMTRRGVFDPLTGLPNRRLFLDRLKRVTVQRPRSESDKEGFSVLFLDLDNFKAINDTLGHKTGDDLLKEVASRLQTCVRASDTVARLGGDEFVVLLEKVRVPVGVQITLDRIVEKLSQPYVLDGRELYVAPSIGVVIDTEHYRDPDELLRDADTAMYSAKESDKVTVIFDVAMRERLRERLELERQLRTALEQEEFMLHFQSIVSLVDGRTEGFEALVRWDHPTRGLLQPDDFIPVMEETGLTVPLGQWVMREACLQMMRRYENVRAEDMPYVSVNLSGKHLGQEDLVAGIEQLLLETGFSGNRLRLEFTETAIIENPRRAASALGQLKLLGVQILMDDFGTGHSSLSYLQNLPIDTLKIDRSFIARMTTEPDGAELVQTIIRMAQNLGLKVVAEGIETPDQVALLQGMACGAAQGYLFARPALFPGSEGRRPKRAPDVRTEESPGPSWRESGPAEDSVSEERPAAAAAEQSSASKEPVGSPHQG